MLIAHRHGGGGADGVGGDCGGAGDSSNVFL